jgi:hypothetical protein
MLKAKNDIDISQNANLQVKKSTKQPEDSIEKQERIFNA